MSTRNASSPYLVSAWVLLIATTGFQSEAIGCMQYENYPWSSPAVSPDGRIIALVGGDRVYLYNCAIPDYGLEQQTILKGHRDAIVGVTFSPDGRRLASGGTDNVAIIWDVSTGNPIARQRFGGFVQAVQFSPDDSIFAAGSADGSVTLWDNAGTTIKGQLPNIDGGIFDLAFQPNSTRLAVAARRRGILVWDIKEGRWVSPIPTAGMDLDLRSVAYSPNGRMIASADHNGSVCLWDSSNFELKLTLKHERVDRVMFCSDGRLFATIGGNRAKLWRLADGTELRDTYCRYACFAPDGKRLLLVRYGAYSWLELDSMNPQLGKPDAPAKEGKSLRPAHQESRHVLTFDLSK